MTGPEFKRKKRQEMVSAERVEMLSERLKHLHPEVVDLTKQLTTLVEEELLQ